jgi:hypothetical protein
MRAFRSLAFDSIANELQLTVADVTELYAAHMSKLTTTLPTADGRVEPAPLAAARRPWSPAGIAMKAATEPH